MRELWVSDWYYSPAYYCPIILNDDGSAVDDAKVTSPTISFFSQPDTGYGEKGVTHITVTDNHIYQNRGSGQPTYNTYFFDEDWNFGPYRVRYRVHTYLNTIIEEYWKGEEYDAAPMQSYWYLIYKYTRPIHTFTYHVNFKCVEWWCSEAYAQEYSAPNGKLHGKSAASYPMYIEREGRNMFNRYMFTEEQALEVLDIVMPSHTVPVGLESELYRNAMNSITCNTNSIANVAEVVGILRDIKSGRIGALASDIPKYLKSVDLKKSASSAWLGYRYAYNTTKSDIKEYREKLLPLVKYKSGKHIVRSGKSLPNGTAHCKVVYSDRALNSVQSVYTMLKRTGLALDAYNAWDMVPLSFVADWFLPIGDYLEDFSQNWVANTAIFDISTVTSSWKWQETYYDSSGCYDISYYNRSVTTEPPEFESYSEDPSTKTVLKRIVDAAALIVG